MKYSHINETNEKNVKFMKSMSNMNPLMVFLKSQQKCESQHLPKSQQKSPKVKLV